MAILKGNKRGYKKDSQQALKIISAKMSMAWIGGRIRGDNKRNSRYIFY